MLGSLGTEPSWLRLHPVLGGGGHMGRVPGLMCGRWGQVLRGRILVGAQPVGSELPTAIPCPVPAEEGSREDPRAAGSAHCTPTPPNPDRTPSP